MWSYGLAVLAAENDFGDTRGGAVAGPLGLFVVVLIGVATWLLIRNMSGRLKRLPATFDPPPGGSPVEGGTPRSDAP